MVDAYLSPVLRRYVQHVADELGEVRLMFMQSNGGLAEAGHFRGKDAILSGPAGGIVGMARMSALAGFDRVIGFDMGGTSTDVSHYAGEYERVFDTQVAGVRLRAPMLAIHTVAAGGGSILHFDGSRYRVGPDSAGADPGPACYRRGGPLTVTDANVMLGRIQPAHFPHVFGPGGDQPLDPLVVRRRFVELAAEIAAATGDDRTPEQVAEGFLQIAVANMANAVKKISVQKGHDVTEYALTTFGGAGGQHACAVADVLGITTVLVPPMAGVLSALGIGLADVVAMREQSVERPLESGVMPRLQELAAELEDAARAELTDQECAGGPDPGHPPRTSALRRHRHRPAGRARRAGRNDRRVRSRLPAHLLVPDGPPARRRSAVRRGCTAARRGPDGPPPHVGAAAPATAAREPASGSSLLPRWASGGPSRCIGAERLRPGAAVVGPAIIAEDDATTVVDDGWRATVTPHGHLRLERVRARAWTRLTSGTEVDPVMLEIFNNLFMSIAEQMGVRLESTAQSVNIKERLDFSCAVFDPGGNLIANAPHMPVHLGSMGTSIKEVIRRNAGTMRPGHVYAINDPYHGGTHLPDVTVVTPVYDNAGRDLLFFVAARGHHAEIGGLTPGSMPAMSRNVHEEGVLFDNWLLVSRWQAARGRNTEAAEPGAVSVAQSADEPRRFPRSDRGQREGRRGVAANDRSLRPRRRARLYGARPGQRRGSSPAGHRRLE